MFNVDLEKIITQKLGKESDPESGEAIKELISRKIEKEIPIIEEHIIFKPGELNDTN